MEWDSLVVSVQLSWSLMIEMFLSKCSVNIYVWSAAAQYHFGQYLERWECDELMYYQQMIDIRIMN